jgi:hypothetical protein
MNLCALIALHGFFTPEGQPPAIILSREEAPPPSLEGLSSAFLLEPEVHEDLIFDCYREPASRDWVILFFTRICGSREVAESVLINAENHNVSPSLAFALCWEESRYRIDAVNRRNQDGSIDRGLFQLNNRSFPALTDADFFNPRVNAWYGMGHLRFCLDTGGSEIAALAMYNAGTGRVRSTGTPKNTLDYISRILASRRKIDNLFRTETARALESFPVLELGLAPDSGDIGTGAELAKAKAPPEMAAEPKVEGKDMDGGARGERFRFAILSPLSGR